MEYPGATVGGMAHGRGFTTSLFSVCPPDESGLIESISAVTGTEGFADIVLHFNQVAWIAGRGPISVFDYNGNGQIDFADVVRLINHL